MMKYAVQWRKGFSEEWQVEYVGRYKRDAVMYYNAVVNTLPKVDCRIVRMRGRDENQFETIMEKENHE